MRLERAATAAAKATAGKSSATAATPKARSRRTRSGRGYEHLVHIRRHPMHGTGKQDWIEARAVAVSGRGGIPTRWIFDDAREGLCPVVFHAQSHGIGKKFLECAGGHYFEAIGVDAVHEFLKSEHGDVSTRAFDSLRRHHASEQPPDQRADQDTQDQRRNRTEKVSPAEVLDDSKRNDNAESRAEAVSVGGFGVERVNAFLLERRHNISADHRDGGVETVLEAGQASVGDVVRKNVFHHDSLVRSEIIPILPLLQ